MEKGLISMNFCDNENQIADIFTKTLSREPYERNRPELGLIKLFECALIINPMTG